MGTDTYRIRVVRVNRQKCIVVFRVYKTYYEDNHYMPMDISFFVMLLNEDRWLLPNSTTLTPNPSPSSRFVADGLYANVFDKRWMADHAHDFVVNATMMAYAPSTLKEKALFIYSAFKKERQLEQALYEVQFTDVSWMQHFHVGHVWQTACFELLHSLPIDTSILDATTTPSTKPNTESKAAPKRIKKSQASAAKRNTKAAASSSKIRSRQTAAKKGATAKSVVKKVVKSKKR
ncbi:hypothetical protein ACHHYP_00220 [Achlya hypogyna]|uniref:Uncharacterized protein n=1 Tax=Achlya hypogyna TaxID=1202772 RepID=A0A1V9ZBB3_ACHHY|nr:hypothetical protein ACHHYP_00220 [Achlya hypogyna]